VKNKLNSPFFQEPNFDNHHEAICMLDLEGDLLYANQAFSTIFGYSNEELLDLNYKHIVSSESMDIFDYYFQKSTITETQDFITSINCKDGTKVEVKVVTVSNEVNEKVRSIYCFFTEAIDQPLIHAGLRQTSDLTQSFVENNRDPILILDLEAIIVLANRAFSKLLGWRKENLEGFHILECPSIPPHLIEQMRDYYERVISGDPDLTTLETIRITDKGKEFNMSLTITPLYDQDGNVCNWAVQLREISEKRQLRKAIRSGTIISSWTKK
jgi:PAS domain S-box-containing protein